MSSDPRWSRAVITGGGVVVAGPVTEPVDLPKRARCVEASEAALRARLSGVDRKRMKWMAPDVLAAHIAVSTALAEAFGDADAPCRGPRCGVFVGTRMASQMHPRLASAIAAAGTSAPPDPAVYFERLEKGVNPVHQLLYLSNRVALHLAITLGAQGPSRTFGGSAVASGQALLDAASAVEDGEVERAVVGGVDLALDPVGRVLECVAGLDAAPGGAASFLLLERETDARERGAGILGWLRSGATPSGDGGRLGAAALEKRARERALARGGLDAVPTVRAGLGDLAPGNAWLPAQILESCALLGDQRGPRPGAALCSQADRDLGAAAFVLEVV